MGLRMCDRKTWPYVCYGVLTLQALTADSIYVASAGVDALIGAHERGADITMIGGLLTVSFEYDWRQTVQDLRRSTRHHNRHANANFRDRLGLAVGTQSARSEISARLQAAQHR